MEMRVMSEQLDGLTNAISGAPNLAGALCTGEWRTFDEEVDPIVIEAAVDSCRHCPVVGACRDWLDTLPPKQRPPGVTAGVVNRWVDHESRRSRRVRVAEPPSRRRKAGAA
jgi:hypothetical protein